MATLALLSASRMRKVLRADVKWMQTPTPGTDRGATSPDWEVSMLSALALALGFPAGILLMLVTMAALDPTSDPTPSATWLRRCESRRQ